MKPRKMVLTAIIALIVLAGLPAGVAQAAKFEVPCSEEAALIAAVNAANADPGSDSIILNPEETPNCEYQLTSGSGGNGLPVLLGKLKIDGNGSRIRRSSATFRILEVHVDAKVSIKNTIISHGIALFDSDGGGILNHGALSLKDVTVSNNSAGAGNASPPAPVPSPGGDGGGIFNASTGTLKLSKVVISMNAAGPAGPSTYFGASGGNGGGIFNGGVLKSSKTTISDNIAGAGGSSPGDIGGQGGWGGGVFNTGVMTLKATITGNRGGAGGPGDPSGGGGHGGGVFNEFGAQAKISSEIHMNFTGAAGGPGAHDGLGGGILHNDASDPLKVKPGTVTNNTKAAGYDTDNCVNVEGCGP